MPRSPTMTSLPARSSFVPMMQRKCACGGTPGPTGECEACKKKKRLGLRTKLTVNEPGDIYEQEADRIADQVLATPVQSGVSGARPRIQCLATQPTGQVETAPASVDHAISDPGRPLEPRLRQDMEHHFGYDFSRVRVHSGTIAEQSARDVNAHAYTLGHNIVFGPGRFAPKSREGGRLLAHELTHVVQQRQGARPELQRSALRDFNDSDVMHDPSKLTDDQIEATNEFKAYMDSKLKWQWQHKMTRQEALLACRLILRRLREGEHVSWERDAADFMSRARKQLGTLKETEKLVGKLAWVGASWTQFASPTTAESDFTRWLLADKPEPTDLSKMNCWEMILFGAFRARIVDKAWIRNTYQSAAAWTIRRPDLATAPPAEIENQLCGVSSTVTFKPTATEPGSPEPLPGDIIIFNAIENHAAISLGKTMIGGDHLVISLHASPAAPHNQVEMTTLEQLLTDTGLTSARLCRAPWRGKGRP